MSFIMESWTVTFRGTKHSSTVQNLNPGQSVWSSNGTCISTFNNLKKSMRHRTTKLNKVILLHCPPLWERHVPGPESKV